jgi:DNA-binding FadR family transcriptional regulator
VFTPAVRRRAFDDIVDQVERAVLSGELHPGDRLPRERELCTQFGVGRAALREALRTLEERGIVETKVGQAGGIFICTPDPAMAGRTLSALILFGGADVRELAEFRISFEAETARWAARRATEQDVAALRRIADRLSALTAAHPDAGRTFTELDLAFHKQIAVASGNRIRVAVLAALTGSLSRAVASIESSMTADLLREEAEDVRAVVAAVAAGDEDRASELLRDHVTRFSALEIEALEGAALRATREPVARARP